MTIHTAIAPEATPNTPARLQRQDGWTPAAQRAFLEAIAEGHPVGVACRRAGLSHQSAYAFRRRAAGASFALGWQAASILARHRIADELVSRAIDGQVDTITRPDGSVVTRHRFDNRLAMSMLTRLDRLADTQVAEGTHHAARLVAQEFDAFLDVIDADASPARAGLFVGLRVGGATDMTAAELAPVVALARADRWCRTGAALADDITVGDLDPAQRAHWTAEQWARAEAAGLLTLAPPPAINAPAESAKNGANSEGATESNGNLQLMQLHAMQPDGQDRRGTRADAGIDDDDDRVWWDDEDEQWRTSFPPPPDFDGYQDGRFGDEGYARSLSPAEEDAIELMHEAEIAPIRAAAARARDIWFGFIDPAAGPSETAPETAPDLRPSASNPSASNHPAEHVPQMGDGQRDRAADEAIG